MMLAASLSSVIRFGVDRMLAPPLLCSALASAFMLRIWPTPGRLMVPSITPIFRPSLGSTSSVVRAPVLSPLPPVAPPKWVPPKVRPLPSIHCTPSSAASVWLTSTIRLSTSTCARRWSSWSITRRRLRYTGSGAEISSVLVATSACTEMPFWLKPVLPASIGSRRLGSSRCDSSALPPVLACCGCDGCAGAERLASPSSGVMPSLLPIAAASL